MSPLVQAQKISKLFPGLPTPVLVLDDVSLEVYPGELMLLMGPSGSGKTTLISILAGLMRPSSGEVTINGVALSSLDEAGLARLRRANLGFIFQTYNLFPAMTALDNVALAFTMRGHDKGSARAQAALALSAVGLGDRLGHRPALLSSGQKQRVAIARALAGDPPIVIGDEPTAALDRESAMTVMNILRERVTPSSAIIIVTHDPRLESFADRVLRMEDGRIVGHGLTHAEEATS